VLYPHKVPREGLEGAPVRNASRSDSGGGAPF